MAVTMREKDIQLLGYQGVEELTRPEGSRWKLYSASAMAGIDEIQAQFLYFNSSARTSDLLEAKNFTRNSSNLHVLYARSIEVSPKKIEELFPAPKVFEDVLWSKVKSLFSGYLEDLKGSLHYDANFVAPRIAEDPNHDLENEVSGFIQGKIAEVSEKLFVLKASAGVGKTTLSTRLVSTFASSADRFRVIPIFISSAHWGKLQLESISDLWEIINNSIGIYGSYVPVSQDLFINMLEQGLVAFMFDGFDELCARRDSQFNASQIIDDLSRMAQGSEAKIVVTSRSLYWEREVGQKSDQNFFIRELAPFNPQQAKKYFANAFKPTAKAQRATANSIYKKLSDAIHKPKESSARAYFVNLPLCVALIADYVRDGGTQQEVEASSPQGLLRKLLEWVCRRETERQGLDANHREQIECFIELACLYPESPNPTLSVEEDVAAVFSSTDFLKIQEHPLLRQAEAPSAADGLRVQFKYEFLAPFFRALKASEELSSAAELSTPTKQMMRFEGGGKGFALEHVSMMISSTDDFIAYSICEQLAGDYREAQSFIFHLLCEILETSQQKLGREEKADEVFSRLVGPQFSEQRLVRDRVFMGGFHRLDLAGITFVDCSFRDVDFSTARADETSVFSNCEFIGGVDFPQSEVARAKWARAKLDNNCILKFPASAAWNTIRRVDLASRRDELEEVFRLGLNKFWQNGRPKPRIKARDWARGSLGASSLNQRVLDSFIDFGVVVKISSAGSRADIIEFNSDASSDLSKFMNNNQITGRVKKAWDSLIN